MTTNIDSHTAAGKHQLALTDLQLANLRALTETQLSRLTGLSVSFLQHDRTSARLLPFYKIGKAVRYSLPRVQEALAAMEEGGNRTAKRRASAGV